MTNSDGSAAESADGVPGVEAAVRAAFDRYEAALVAHDLEVMNELFLDDAEVVRFGVCDHQVGHAAVAEWRRTHPGVPDGRALHDTRIQILRDSVAVVTTMFSYPDGEILGRQTQVWLSTPAGWKVASAHVSHIPSDGSES